MDLKQRIKILRRKADKDYKNLTADHQKAHQAYHEYISSPIAEMLELTHHSSAEYMEHREKCNILANNYHRLKEQYLENKGRHSAFYEVLELIKEMDSVEE